MTTLQAILLAGGRAQRMGGRDKMLLQVRGQSLLQHAVASVASASQVAIVGPARAVKLDREVIWTREEPQFSGPAAAIAAGFDALNLGRGDEVVILPTDLVNPAELVAALLGAEANCVATDPAGFRQWACCRLVAEDLAAAIAQVDDLANASIRQLLNPIDLTEIQVSGRVCTDLDTEEDAKEYADEQR
ncbi:MAG TPA: NTP transferase domain-containing protein [Aeromicrobium sp.]|nr:NTP transferase domain-containing protein [Aeromicrobium sp.]